MFSSFCVSLHPPPLPIPHSNAVQVIAFLCNCNFNCYQSRWSSSRPPPPSVSQYLPCTHFHTSHFLPYGSHLRANYYQFVHVDAINSQSWGRSIKRLNETSKSQAKASQKPPKRKASATDATSCGKCPCWGAALWPQQLINQVVTGRIYRPKSKSTSASPRPSKVCHGAGRKNLSNIEENGQKRKIPHVMASMESCLWNFFGGTWICSLMKYSHFISYYIPSLQLRSCEETKSYCFAFQLVHTTTIRKD